MPETTALSVPSAPGAENEDAMVVSSDVVVVVDGAGLPKAMRAGCRHSVAWFARSIAERFHAALTGRTGTMRSALADAITAVRDAHATVCDLAAGSPAATVAAWRQSADGLEYLVLCDASLLVVTARGRTEQITDGRLEAAVERAMSDPAVRNEVRPRAAARRRVEAERNRRGGWWCVGDDPAAADEALTGVLPPDGLVGVVACSDGATRAFALLGVDTVEGLAARCLRGDAETAVAAIRRAERSREDALRAEGAKPHDDLTIVARSFGGAPR